MKPLKSLIKSTALATVAVMGMATAALAEFPEKNIKVIIGFSAGGGADTFIRTVGKYAPEYLGTEFDYAYHKGGGGTVAVNEMLKSGDADGYTLAVGILPHQVIPTQIGDVGYTPMDVNWLTTFSMIPNGIYVSASSDYQTLDDLIDAAKANPGKLAAALPGPASGNALFFTQFKNATGTDMPDIHYGGGSDMYKALLGGETVVMVTNANWATRQPDELRLLGLASDARFKLTPEVPTLQELGLDLIDASVRAVIAPAGIPDDVATRLEAGFAAMAADPAFVEDMAKAGLVVDYRDAAATNAFVVNFVSSNQATFEALKASN